MVDPNAAMHLVGDVTNGDRAKRVYMVAVDGDVSINDVGGAVTASRIEMTQVPSTAVESPVTPSAAQRRESVYRPVFTQIDKERFDIYGGIRAVIEAGLKAMEETK
jgi:hypothetical protein